MLNRFMYNKIIFLSRMSDEITLTVAAYKLLASPENIIILRALKEKPSKAKDLEDIVNLDRMSIKRRLYKLVKVGLVKEEKVKSKKAIAIVYSVKNKSLPKINLFQVLDNVDSNKAKELTKI